MSFLSTTMMEKLGAAVTVEMLVQRAPHVPMAKEHRADRAATLDKVSGRSTAGTAARLALKAARLWRRL
jgi:hypothetical protein